MDSQSILVKQKTQRIAYIDITKLLSIYLVLLGHVIQYLRQDVSPTNNDVWLFIYSFHMPLFMMIAGYFSIRAAEENTLVLIKKKSGQLLLPCLTWGVFWLLLRQIFIVQPQNTFASTHLILNEVSVFIFDILWFLKCLFACLVLYSIFKKNTVLLFFSLFLSQILPFKIPLMYPCFIVGIFFRKIDFFNKITCNYALVLLVIFIVAYHYFEPQYLNSNLRYSAMQLLSGDYMPVFIELLIRLYRLFVGIIGSLVLVSFVKIVVTKYETCVDFSKIANLGSQTQAIYILHGPIVTFIIVSLFDFNSTDIVLFNYIIAPTISILLLVFCSFLINMLPPNTRKMIFGTKN